MDCPVCKEPMIVFELEGVEIDYCCSCKGIWLDSGELGLLLENAIDKEKLLSSFEIDIKSKEKKRKCPICLKKMKKVNVGSTKKILIDKCKNDHGLWFDGGELAEIIKMGNLDRENRIITLLEGIFPDK